MAKFRKNHGDDEPKKFSSSKGKGPSKSLRSIAWLVMIFILMYILSQVDATSWNPKTPVENNKGNQGQQYTLSDSKSDNVKRNFYPVSTTGQVIEHKYYTLSYDEKHEQSEWVAYKLTKKNLQLPNVKRARKFKPDNAVSYRSAFHRDYTHSGYTRGHLAPAGDMAFSSDAMQESFYMSNMSPQLKEFNGGIWRELEETVRDWAYENDELYIISGPILANGHVIKKIGKNKVSVPDYFYKIILDNYGSTKKVISFLMPNEKSDKPIIDYITSIDKIEKITGIDFFADFLEEDFEKKIEASTSAKGWKFNKKKYRKRIQNWNNR